MKSFAKFVSIAVMGSFLTGCASEFAFVPEIPQHAQAKLLDYFEQPDQKVFVIAIDPNGQYAFGYDYGKPSLKDAAKVAADKCNANRESYGIVGKAYIYAINNKVVYEEMIQRAHHANKSAAMKAQQDEVARQEMTGEANKDSE